jgi:hypothetical protein
MLFGFPTHIDLLLVDGLECPKLPYQGRDRQLN